MNLSRLTPYVCVGALTLGFGCAQEPPQQLTPQLTQADIRAIVDPQMAEVRQAIADLHVNLDDLASRVDELDAQFGGKEIALQPHELLPPDVEALYDSAPDQWEQTMRSELSRLTTIAKVAQEYVAAVSGLEGSLEAMEVIADAYPEIDTDLDSATSHVGRLARSRPTDSVRGGGGATDEPVFELLALGDGVAVVEIDGALFRLVVGDRVGLPIGSVRLVSANTRQARLQHNSKTLTLEL